MNILEKMSPASKETFASYIKTYGPNNGSGGEDDDVYFSMTKDLDDIAPVDYILREWASAKSLFLEKVFGDQLIVRQKVDYEKSINEIDFNYLHCCNLTDRITNLSKNHQFGVYWRIQEQHNFSDNDIPEDFIYEYYPNGEWSNTMSGTAWRCEHLYQLIMSRHYAYDNIYNGSTFSIKRYDKDPLKIVQGTKYSKVVGKIAAYLDIPNEYYEEWRLIHSQLINDKHVHGDLCLSIHPMDYITMSDGIFSSCMNWSESGCYRRGTVEMMNSNSVVVAYLESEKDSLNWEYKDDEYSWNAKKWRTLLIATPDFVNTIKSYPYEHRELSVKALNMLTKMIEATTHYRYQEEVADFCSDVFYAAKNHKETSISFSAAGAMYCDMGATTHFIRLSSNFDYENDTHYHDYCGVSECMFCGAVCSQEDFFNPSCVFCSSCQETLTEQETCEFCGRSIARDDVTWIDDVSYCPECAKNRISFCVKCGSLFDCDDAIPIIVTYKGIGKAKRFDLDDLVEEAIASNTPCCCSYCYEAIKNVKTDPTYFDRFSWMTPKSFSSAFGVDDLDSIHTDSILDSWGDEREAIFVNAPEKINYNVSNPFSSCLGVCTKDGTARKLALIENCILDSDYQAHTNEEIREMINQNIIERASEKTLHVDFSKFS